MTQPHSPLAMAGTNSSARGACVLYVSEHGKWIQLDEQARRVLGVDGAESDCPRELIEALRAAPAAENDEWISVTFEAQGSRERLHASWRSKSPDLQLAASGERVHVVIVERERDVKLHAERVRGLVETHRMRRSARRFVHDVRTPLNAANLNLVVLERALTRPASQAESAHVGETLRAMRRQVERLELSIRGFSSTLAGSAVDRTEHDLAKLTRDALQELEPVLLAERASYQISAPSTAVLGRVDPAHFVHGILSAALAILEIHPHADLEFVLTTDGGNATLRIGSRSGEAAQQGVFPGDGALSPAAERHRTCAIEDFEECGALVASGQGTAPDRFVLGFPR